MIIRVIKLVLLLSVVSLVSSAKNSLPEEIVEDDELIRADIEFRSLFIQNKEQLIRSNTVSLASSYNKTQVLALLVDEGLCLNQAYACFNRLVSHQQSETGQHAVWEQMFNQVQAAYDLCEFSPLFRDEDDDGQFYRNVLTRISNKESALALKLGDPSVQDVFVPLGSERKYRLKPGPKSRYKITFKPEQFTAIRLAKKNVTLSEFVRSKFPEEKP